MTQEAKSRFVGGVEASASPASTTALAPILRRAALAPILRRAALAPILRRAALALTLCAALPGPSAEASAAPPSPRFLPVDQAEARPDDAPQGPDSPETSPDDARRTPDPPDSSSSSNSSNSSKSSTSPDPGPDPDRPAPATRYPLDQLDLGPTPEAPAAEAPSSTDPAGPQTTKTGASEDARRQPSVTVDTSASPHGVRGSTPRLTLTPSVEFNLRTQGRFNADFDPAAGDRAVDIFQRARLGLNAAYDEHVGVFIQAQDVRNWGFEDSTIANMANTDLHQGFLYLQGSKRAASGVIKIGRQELNVGSGRLIANRNWVPVAQSFDAVRLMGELGRWSADAGLMLLRSPGSFTIPHPSGDPTLTETISSSGTLSGYALLKLDLGRVGAVEALGIGLRERPSPSAPTASRDLINGGLRLYGAPLPGLSYDLEGYVQGGSNLGLAHRAFAGFATLKYALKLRARPSFTLRYNYASGESCEEGPEVGCGNRQSREFYRFYGARHPFYGILDRVANSNLRNLEVGASLRGRTIHSGTGASFDRLRGSLTYNFIQLDKPTGAWRSAPDPLIGRGWDPTNTSRNLGHEVDLILSYKPLEKLTVQPGYGLFVPLEAGQRIAGPATQHFAYLMLLAIF